MGNTIRNMTSISTSGDRAIEIRREFDAPAALVFRAHTDATLIPRWWGPRRLSTIVDQLDTRAGGGWRFLSRDDAGAEFGFHGVFHTVTRDRLIVRTFEFEGEPGRVALETITFEPLGERTRVVAVSVFQAPADRDGMMESGMEIGVDEMYERMDELLVTLR